MAVDDDDLAATAATTKRRIDWDSVMVSARVGPARWQLRPASSSPDTSVYTRQESSRFDVLSVGLVPGCVAEILNVLQSHTSEQYAQQMEGIYATQFRSGEIVHSVDLAARKPVSETEATLAELTVKRVRFHKASWYANHEEWCYADAVYRSTHGGRNAAVEKLMTTMQATAIGSADPATSHVNTFHDVVCGYLLRAGAEDTPCTESEDKEGDQRVPRVTRVSFYGEFQVPKQIGFSLGAAAAWRRSTAASDKTIKQRLVGLAESTARLTALVRRQRLGLQGLVDGNRFLPPTNAPCRVCTRMLLVAKLCRVCGHGVCSDCSAKHERARMVPGSHVLDVTRVRVCADCVARIDQAEYGNLTSTSLLGTHVVARPSSSTDEPSTSLQALLRDALLTAPSPSRKATVKNVIQCVLDQATTSERDRSDSAHSSQRTTPTLSPTSSDGDYADALAWLTLDDVELRSDDRRCYQIDTSGSETAVPPPVPDNEEARLEAVARMSVPALATVVELEILCELATRELSCDSSVIGLIDRDLYFAIASNAPALRQVIVPRTQSMCAHTIMESHRPLLVSHPEMDVRFSKFASIDQFGVRFYCAFPLLADDGHVVGSMCCIHNTSLDIDASQLAAFKKLAATAAKVMRVETESRRRRKDSAVSFGPVDCP